MDLITELTILVLAAFVGLEVISKVPNTLHTPLMSATNAIHGIVLLGGLLLIGEADGFLNKLLCVIAIAFGTINVVGGFLVTDRMLEMFKRRPEPKKDPQARDGRRLLAPGPGLHPDLLHRRVLALHRRACACSTTRARARRGNMVAAAGMAVAVVATLLDERVGDYGLIALGIVLGTAVGVPAARSVKMTAMPQMVALFNGVGGGAVALIAWAEFRDSGATCPTDVIIPLVFAAIVGSISFWGSNIAFGKLQEILPGRPIQLPGQQFDQRRAAGRGGRVRGRRSRPAPSRRASSSCCWSPRPSSATCSCSRSAARTCRS